MEKSLEFGKEILLAQPISKLVRAELKVFQCERAEISLAITDLLKQQHGFVHGGIVSYLADNCLTFAGGSVLGDSVTSEYKINFVRPAVGESLVAKSTVLSSGKKQAVCECKVYAISDSQELLVAVAQGTVVKAK